MMANLTANHPTTGLARKRGETALFDEMCAVAEGAQAIKDTCLSAIDRDTDAFNDLMSAMRLKGDERAEAIQQATKGAIDVPLEVLEAARDAAGLAIRSLEKGLSSSASDAATGAAMALAAAQGAYYNVLINSRDLTDSTWRDSALARARKALEETRRLSERARESLEASLSRAPAAP